MGDVRRSEFSSERKKISKHQGYALTTSTLQAALEGLPYVVSTHLIHGGGIFFSCDIWLARKDIPFDRLYVYAGAVPKVIAHDARAYVRDIVLPDLTAWIEQQLAQAGRPITSEMVRHFPSEMRDMPQLYFRRDLPDMLARKLKVGH